MQYTPTENKLLLKIWFHLFKSLWKSSSLKLWHGFLQTEDEAEPKVRSAGGAWSGLCGWVLPAHRALLTLLLLSPSQSSCFILLCLVCLFAFPLS